MPSLPVIKRWINTSLAIELSNSHYNNLIKLRLKSILVNQTPPKHVDKKYIKNSNKNSEKFKIQNLQRYKNSDRNYKPFKSDRWKKHGGHGGWGGGLKTPGLNRVKSSLCNKGHLCTYNIYVYKRPKKYSEH